MDIYLAGVVIIILGCVIVYQAVTYYLDRMRLIKQNSDLLDRLMAGDFTNYSAGKAMQAKHGKRGILQWRKKKEEAEEDQDDTPKQEHIGLSVT